MSEQTTNVAGFFNPHAHPVYFEISELNIKVDLPAGKYIMDTQGNLLNDPIFEAYCHPKGLSKAIAPQPVPLRLVPRPETVVRPQQAVTQASAFVRSPTGTVVPVYDQPPQQVQSPVNKNPIIGMSVEKARQLGLIGKPRLVPEDYGADETTGAPERGKKLPDIKVSIESPPRVRTAAPLAPEMMTAESQDFNNPAEVARRQQLNQALNTGAAAPSPVQFNPNVPMRGPAAVRPPVALRATDEPVGIVGASQIMPTERIEPVAVQPAQPPPEPPAPEPSAAAQPMPGTARRPVAAKRTTVVQPTTPQAVMSESIQIQPQQPQQEGEAEGEVVEAEPEGTFVCGADAKRFKYRSELERHVRRHFPHMAADLMKPYPPTQ